jgi:hypothetical protein
MDRQEALDTLRMMEEDYPSMPPSIQKTDLEKINRLRAGLGLPQVDALLDPLKVQEAPKPAQKPAKPAPKSKKSLDRARQVYAEYLEKSAELKKHQEYADRVCRATAGSGQTPVEPLATMGCGGGPLLCDFCHKPIILEGGPQHGMYADEGWKKHGKKGWKSWIKGGMVVEVVENYTVRIYHGYQYNPNDCCQKRQAFAGGDPKPIPAGLWGELEELLEVEMPKASKTDRARVLQDLISLLFHPQPGFGVNRPE